MVLFTYLLLVPDIIDYNSVIVYGRSLHQPEYKIMKAAFDKGLSKAQSKILFQSQNEVREEGGVEQFIQEYVGPFKGDVTAPFNTDELFAIQKIMI